MLLKQLLVPVLGKRAAAVPPPAQFGVIAVVEHIHPAGHAGVRVAAIFGAIKAVASGFCGCEPQAVDSAREPHHAAPETRGSRSCG